MGKGREREEGTEKKKGRGVGREGVGEEKEIDR
jgi:hypothetical protein